MTVKDFDIKQILDSGQCFRYMEVDKDHYRIVSEGNDFEVMQKGNEVYFSDCTLDYFNHYFDLKTDYGEIKKVLSRDKKLEKIIEYNSGIRILNQNKWECLVCFILSQQNNIPRIQLLINNLCTSYGHLDLYAHTFPSPNDLSDLTVDDYNRLGFGYRSKYIVDAVKSNDILYSINSNMSTSEVISRLKVISGVGDKIANCVALFAFHRFDSFPVDVWIRRAMIDIYGFSSFVSNEYIQDFALSEYGEYCGIAQQYIFKYYRDRR